MRITNIYNLPMALLNAASVGNTKPVEGQYRATALIDSPQIRNLIIEHWDEIEDDVSARLWAMLGQMFHSVMQNHAPTNSLDEEQLAISVDGIIVSGRPDLYVDSHIDDYKVTSVWSFVHGVKKSWAEQLNVYAYMYRQMRFPVEALNIMAILRDWNINEAKSNTNYPVIPFIETPIPLWNEDQQLYYIRERLRIHREVNTCTDEERWYKGTKFACIKDGNKRATRVFDDKDEAIKFVISQPDKIQKHMNVIERPGEYTRCERYCIVSKFCPQWAEYNLLKIPEEADNPETAKEN